jgi:hypothetical protein
MVQNKKNHPLSADALDACEERNHLPASLKYLKQNQGQRSDLVSDVD